MSLAFTTKDTTFRCPGCGHDKFVEKTVVRFAQNKPETNSGEHTVKYREVSYTCETCGFPLFTKTMPFEE